MLKAYAIGFLGAALAVAIAIAVANGLRAEEQTGLRWGGTVYTSKAEFQVYLKSKGLSYETWLARNPGAAPWERVAVRRVAARSAAAADERSARQTDDVVLPFPGWWPLAVVAAVLAGSAALLISRGGLPARTPGIRRYPVVAIKRLTAVGRTTLPSSRRVGVFASDLARRLELAAPHYGERVLESVRTTPGHLRNALQLWNVRGGDIAIAILAVMASMCLGVFIVVLLN